MTPKSGKPTESVAQVTNVTQSFTRLLNETSDSHKTRKISPTIKSAFNMAASESIMGKCMGVRKIQTV